MGRCTDRRDMTKAVESGVKLQTNKLIEDVLLKLINTNSWDTNDILKNVYIDHDLLL